MPWYYNTLKSDIEKHVESLVQNFAYGNISIGLEL